VKRLGEQGLVSVSDDINMENYQKMQDFYSAYVSGRDMQGLPCLAYTWMGI
jgi:hypothetical protein